MHQKPNYLIALVLIVISVIIPMTGCSLTQVRFDLKLDKTDYLDYSFGGGELGAEWTQIVICGDGRVTYLYRLPYTGTWPQEEITIEYQLSEPETLDFFQSLVDAGLYDLKNQETGGVDVPRTSIRSTLDGHSLKVSFDGTPGEEIHNKIMVLIKEVHPER